MLNQLIPEFVNLYCLINAESVDTRIMVVPLSIPMLCLILSCTIKDLRSDNVKISDFSIFGTLHLQYLSKADY